jgi:putative ABC transport system permease protein
VQIWNSTDKQDQFSVAYPDFADWRAQNQSCERLAAWTDTGLTLTGTAEALCLQGTIVTADLFPLLGVSPKIGRVFVPEEDQPNRRVAILGHNLWRERFAADANIVGQAITLNGESYTVVGVMPAGLMAPTQNEPSDVWLSAGHYGGGRGALTNQRGNHAFEVVGRLKPGVTLPQAQAEMNAIAANLKQQYPDINVDFGVRVASLHEDLVRDVRPTLLILLAAVGCVLLIACANVANLLLARATTRHKEMAIRAALGASRLRVVRQLLTESTLLGVGGGLVGLLLALWGTDLLVSIVPKGLPRVGEASVDGRVLGFTVLIALATGILFGLVPALQASKSDLVEALKEGGKGAGDGARRSRLRSGLIVAEVAVAVMLLVGAGLLVNSFLRLQSVNPGFNPHNVLTFRIGLPDSRYPQPEQITTFYQQLVARLETLPGVASASAIAPLPLSGQGAGVGFSIEGMALPPNQPFAYDADFRTVTPGHFRTMGMTLVKGRDFTARDGLQSTPVAIINETLARRYFPDGDPLGKRINPSFSIGTGEPLMREIIGVVRDVKHASLRVDAEPEIYVTHAQFPRNSMTLVVRADSDPNRLIGAIRNEVQQLDNELPVFNVKTLDQYLSASVAEPRFNTLLIGSFAGLALLLTAIGLYGVMSYAVTQRTHEIGIRMALGARPRDVLRLIIGQGMGMAVIGMGIGIAAAYGLTRVMASLLYGVSATDPTTFAVVIALLTVVALLACYIPARRATKVDPMVALRYE